MIDTSYGAVALGSRRQMLAEAGLPLVSVFTPVYNAEPYLAHCIESVLSQTYKHFEYTIVNNCSTDRSLEIARYYEMTDPRIRVVNTHTFLDQISNFIYAATLVAPSAAYCKFAFADDVLFPGCLEQMVRVAECDSQISVVSGFVTNGIAVGARGVPFGTNVLPGRDACRLYLLQGVSPFTSFNGLLFRADHIRQRRPLCRNDGFFEDADLCFELLRNGKLGFVHQIVAFNRRDNESELSRIESYNPHLLTDLLFLHRYGSVFLDQGEFKQRWYAKMKEYRSFLIKSALCRKDAAFWSFHRKGMQELGMTLGPRRVAWGALLLLCDWALNPKATIEKALHAICRWK